MHAYIHTYIYIIHTYIHNTYIHIYIHTYIDVVIHIYICRLAAAPRTSVGYNKHTNSTQRHFSKKVFSVRLHVLELLVPAL